MVGLRQNGAELLMKSKRLEIKYNKKRNSKFSPAILEVARNNVKEFEAR